MKLKEQHNNSTEGIQTTPAYVINQDKAGDAWATWLSDEVETYAGFESRAINTIVAFADSPQQSALDFIKRLNNSEGFVIYKV